MQDHSDVRLTIPSLAGAWVLKSDAYRLDSRDRERHLDDLAILIAAAPDLREISGQLTKTDRRRLRSALPDLHHHLSVAPGELAARSLRRLPQLASYVGLEGPLTSAAPNTRRHPRRPLPGTGRGPG